MKIKAQIVEKLIEGEKVSIMTMGVKANLKVISEKDDRWIIEGYASVFGNVDSYYEIVDKGAFNDFLAKWPADSKTGVPRFPKFIWAHDWARPLGPTLEVREDEIGLYVKGELLKDVQDAKEAYALIKSGAMTDLSFGFRVDQDEIDQNTGARHLKKISIYEWSPVLVGANEKATITGVKDANQKAEGDYCTMDDGTEGEMHPDDSGNMVCMVKVAKTAAGSEPAPEDGVKPAPTAVDNEAGTDGKPAGVDAPVVGDDKGQKAGRVLSSKNRKIVETAIEAMGNVQTALEALLEAADESGSSNSETGVDQRGGSSTLKLILRDARQVDKTIEKIILRAKKI